MYDRRVKCDRCGGQEATVHEMRIAGGKKVERHLCEACARSEGLPVQPALSVPAILGHLLGKQPAPAGAVASGEAGAGADLTKIVCAACGTTYAQFRHTGLLGCAECYRAFEQPLGPLLRRAHEGGIRHEGKVPRRFRAAASAASAASAAAAGSAALSPSASAARGAGGSAAGSAGGAGGSAGGGEARVELLRRQLAAAIAAEQYEAAATLRDELRRLEERGRPGGGAAPGTGRP